MKNNPSMQTPKEQKNENKNETALVKWLKHAFVHNAGLKILAFVFALLLWGYVLTQINPTRVKAVQDVRVSFEGESALQERGLVVRGNRDEILENVVVRVKTELTSYADLTANDVNASINLNTVSKTGSVTLPIRAYTSVGSADSVQPSTVTLEIDNLAVKNVPVEVNYEGSVPSGYWSGEPQLSRTEVEIKGAATDVNRIAKAVCTVSLAGRTQTFNEAVNLTLLDQNGEELSSDLFIGETPSITIKVRVLAEKTVPVDLESAILGTDSLPSSYEIVEKKTTPETVTIVGAKSVLDGIDSVEIEGVDISGRTESLHDTREIKLPDGVETVSGTTEVEVYINIQEKQVQKVFPDLPVTVKGLAKGLTASLNLENLTASITGPTSMVSGLSTRDISLSVDVTNLGEGSYQLPVTLSVSDKNTRVQDLTVVLLSEDLTVEQVVVTIETR